MSILRSILKNTFLLSVGQLSAKILGIIFVALLARSIGAEGLGIYSYAISLIAIFLILPSFGFDMLMVRELARTKEQIADFIENVLSIKIILALFASIVLIFFLNISQ